jgi:hypothetical protein
MPVNTLFSASEEYLIDLWRIEEDRLLKPGSVVVCPRTPW